MSSPNFAELLATFVEQLEAQPQYPWWEQFYAECPEAAVLCARCLEIVRERSLEELTDEELREVERLTEQVHGLADDYAAVRGEAVPAEA